MPTLRHHLMLNLSRGLTAFLNLEVGIVRHASRSSKAEKSGPEDLPIVKESPKSRSRVSEGSLERVCGPLRIVHEMNAYITPFAYDRKTSSGYGCIYDSNLRRVDESLRTGGIRGDHVKSADPPHLEIPTGDFRWYPREVVYLGHLMGQYGHFLTETLSTFWALQYTKNHNILFHPFIFGKETRGFMEPFFEAFGISADRIEIVTEPLKLNSVLIPERTFHLNDRVHERYTAIVHEVADWICPERARSRTRRVFLSRSLLERNNRTIGNYREVDALMKNLGFDIIHPQKMSVVDQVRLYKSTKVMVGFSGSALHNSVFLDPEAVLIEIGDPRTRDKPLPNQILCNLASDCRTFYIPFQYDMRHTAEEANIAPHIECKHLLSRMESILAIL